LRLKLKKAEALLQSNSNPRDYNIIRRELKIYNSRYQTTGIFSNWSNQNYLESISEVCRLIKNLRIKQSRKKGSKTTAMLATAIGSSQKDLTRLIKNYNEKNNTNLTETEAFAATNSNYLGSRLSAEIKYWKACEQVLLTFNDICVAISHIQFNLSFLI
jgi:hypothetical protein